MSAKAWNELPLEVLQIVASVLRTKYPPAVVRSPSDLDTPLVLAFNAGQASVTKDIEDAINTINKRGA